MDNRPDLQTALSTVAFYGLTTAQGRHIVDEVMEVVSTWRDVAHQARIPPADIELTAAAFSAHEAWQGHETRSTPKKGLVDASWSIGPLSNEGELVMLLVIRHAEIGILFTGIPSVAFRRVLHVEAKATDLQVNRM